MSQDSTTLEMLEKSKKNFRTQLAALRSFMVMISFLIEELGLSFNPQNFEDIATMNRLDSMLTLEPSEGSHWHIDNATKYLERMLRDTKARVVFVLTSFVTVNMLKDRINQISFVDKDLRRELDMYATLTKSNPETEGLIEAFTRLYRSIERAEGMDSTASAKARIESILKPAPSRRSKPRNYVLPGKSRESDMDGKKSGKRARGGKREKYVA